MCAGLAALLREFPARREMTEQGEQVHGLGIRLVAQCNGPTAPAAQAAVAPGCAGAMAELHLGEAARFYPTDAALAAWRVQADQGRACIVYE